MLNKSTRPFQVPELERKMDDMEAWKCRLFSPVITFKQER